MFPNILFQIDPSTQTQGLQEAWQGDRKLTVQVFYFMEPDNESKTFLNNNYYEEGKFCVGRIANLRLL